MDYVFAGAGAGGGVRLPGSGHFALVQRLVRLDESNYTLVWPILILTVSAILGVVLAIFIFRDIWRRCPG